MTVIRRVFADGRLAATAPYSAAVIVDMGGAYQIKLAGIAAVDPVTHRVAGYDSHSGEFAPGALERQVADIFAQAEALMRTVSDEIGRPVTFADLTEALVYLRGDQPKAFARFNDAYVAEFTKRGIDRYPVRTTVMRALLPEPNALVEIRFEAAVAAPSRETSK